LPQKGKRRFEEIRRELARSGRLVCCAKIAVVHSEGEEKKERLRMDRDALSGRVLEMFYQTRDERLFRVFYELNADWLGVFVGAVARRLCCPNDPNELISDIFFDIFRCSGSFAFQGGPSFRNWIRVLAVNRVKKAARSRMARPWVSLYSVEERDDDGFGDPLRMMIEHEESSRNISCLLLILYACGLGIDSISPLERKALRLHEMEGMTYRELSEALQISVSEVAACLRRARRKVAKQMNGFFSAQGRPSGRPYGRSRSRTVGQPRISENSRRP